MFVLRALPIDHHLVVCIPRKQFRAQRAYRIKWELLAEKVRHTFASKIASLFRKLSDYTEDVEIEWDLFKSIVITFAASSCGCKHEGGQMGSEKKTAW